MGKKGYLILTGILLIFSSGLAQVDPGIPDTLRVGTATATAYGQQVVVSVFGFNDEELAGIQVPLKYSGVALRADSISYLGGRLTAADIKPVSVDTIGQKITFGAVYFGPYLAAGSGLLAKIFFTVKNGVAPETVVIDTFNEPPVTLSFVDPSTVLIEPQLVTGKVFVNVPPLPQPHNPVISVPGPKQVFGGFSLSFSVTATDVDTGDVLNITMSGPPGATFSSVPKKSPASGIFTWNTTEADTLNSPYLATFIVNDGTGRADTGQVSIEVVPLAIPPSTKGGDLNGDGIVSLVDVMYLVNYIYNNGPPPNPVAAGDIDGDCFITIADIVYLVNYVLKQGPAPLPFCLPGDVNHDGFVNLPDIVYFVNYLLKSGAQPISFKSSDVNTDCHLDLADIVFLVNFIFKGGPLPQPGCVVSTQLAAAVKHTTAEMGMVAHRSENGVLEIAIDLNLTSPAAAVMIKAEYDPAKLVGLQPGLTSRSAGMDLYYNDKGYQQVIGLLDLSGQKFVAPGEGAVLTLRFQVLDWTEFQQAIKITYSEVVAPDASQFEVHLVKGLGTSLDSIK